MPSLQATRERDATMRALVAEVRRLHPPPPKQARRGTPLAERLARFTYVLPDEVGGCHIFLGALNRKGYAIIGISGRGARIASRVAFELEHGPVPEGMELDHLCRVRCCIRVSHLEVVSQDVNLRRGINGMGRTDCPQGHPYDERNAYLTRVGTIVCRKCMSIYSAKWYAAKKSKVA